MFPATITVHNEAQLNAVMAALLGNNPAPAPATQTAKQEDASAKKSQGSTSAKTQEKPAGTPPTAGAGKGAAPESKGASSEPEQGGSDEGAWNTQDGYKDTPEYQAVAAAVIAVAKDKGREAASALLEKTVGVKALPDSKPSQAEAIIAAFTAGV